MSEDSKGRAGLFSLKDLQKMDFGDDEEELFPTGEHAPITGLVSEGAAEEMVAAIRRARILHTDEHIPVDETAPRHSLDELIGGSGTLPELNFTPPPLQPSPPPQVEPAERVRLPEPVTPVAPAEETAEEAEDAASEVQAGAVEPAESRPGDSADLSSVVADIETGARPDQPSQASITVFQTAETHAVIEAAEADLKRRRTRSTVLLVGLPIFFVAVAGGAVAMLLPGPSVSDTAYPTQPVPVVSQPSPVASVEFTMVPEPEPEPEIDEEAERARERRERRERRRHQREERPVIDRGSLF